MDWPVREVTRNQGSGEPCLAPPRWAGGRRAAEKVPWLFSKTGVLVMLFLVLGPFGLIFLYKSPCFSQKARVWLTAAVLVYAGIIVGILAVFLLALSWLAEPYL